MPGDWQSDRKRDDLEISEPVPANWFRRAVFGIRRPTRSREGTLRGAFAASGDVSVRSIWRTGPSPTGTVVVNACSAPAGHRPSTGSVAA